MAQQDSDYPPEFLSVVRLAPDAFFLSDLSGRYLEVNDAGCQLLGATRPEILGKTAFDFVWPEDVDELKQRVRQLESAGVERFELTLRRLDSTRVPVEVHTRRLPGGERQSIVRDISERRQREREQQRAHEVLERLQHICSLHLGNQSDQVVLDAILEAAIAISEADFGDIQDLAPSTGELRIVATRGFPDEWLKFWSHVSAGGQGSCGTALFRQRARVLVKDVEASPLFAGTRGLEVNRRAGVRAVQSTPLFGRTGNPIGVISTHFQTAHCPSESALRRLDLLAIHAAEILDHRRSDRQLRHAQAYASGILAVSADAVISIDTQHRIIEWNPSAEKMFGWSRAEALGMPLAELLPPDRRAAHTDQINHFAEESGFGRQMDHASASGRRKSGDEFPIDATISHLKVDGAQILTVSVRDATERRRQEKEHRLLADLGGALASVDYDATLHQIVGVATLRLADFAAIFLFDDSGSQLHRAATASRDAALAWAAEPLMEFPLRGALAHPVLQVVHEQKTYLADLAPEQYEAMAQSPQHLRALCAVRPRSVLVVPLIAVGKCLGALALSRQAQRFDAHDVVLAETMARRCALHIENVRLYRAEQRATRARDEVLQIVAHDLRNPLNAIGLQLQSLLRRRTDPDRWQEPAAGIRDSCRRMNQLIQDLLDVTRLEAGSLSITLVPLAPEHLLKEVLETQQPLAAAAGIELRRDASSELPAVRADNHRLLQAFENLIGNAIKFTPAGGAITVGATARDEAVEFRVADTGEGIPPEHLAHLFERFWQADHSDRRGAGLGLAIVRGIVEAHGGRVRIESTPGRGTTVFFNIPLATAVQPTQWHRS